MDVELVQRATGAATVGGGATSWYGGLTANEAAAWGGLAVAIIAGAANVLINWYYRRKHYKLAASRVCDHPSHAQRGNATTKVLAGTAAATLIALAATPMIERHEGVSTDAYLDPVGIPTICFGSTAGVEMGQSKTMKQCYDLLTKEVAQHARGVLNCTSATLTIEQAVAITSFGYNAGVRGYCTSQLRAKLNAGDCWGAAEEFNAMPQIDRRTRQPRIWRGNTIYDRQTGEVLLARGDTIKKWTTGGGVPLPGLIKRRAEERALFEQGCKAQNAGAKA